MQENQLELDSALLADALANEIGILSGQLVAERLKMRAALLRLTEQQGQLTAMTLRMQKQDEEICAMRATFPGNHPEHRKRTLAKNQAANALVQNSNS